MVPVFRRGEHILQEKYKTSKKAVSFYNKQMINYLNDDMKCFITNQEMMFISTSDSKGNCDSSFRAGEKGFIKVIDDGMLIYPEYQGNGVMASMGNILENPHIGLMFIDFFKHTIGLHVNGSAEIYETKELHTLRLSDYMINNLEKSEGNRAELWVVVTVEEAYIHCSKHIPKLTKLDKEMMWGTESEQKKGGDFFNVKSRKELRNNSISY